jgi:hypothetical protein
LQPDAEGKLVLPEDIDQLRQEVIMTTDFAYRYCSQLGADATSLLPVLICDFITTGRDTCLKSGAKHVQAIQTAADVTA